MFATNPIKFIGSSKKGGVTGWKEKGVKWERTNRNDEGIWSKYVIYVYDNVTMNSSCIINKQS